MREHSSLFLRKNLPLFCEPKLMKELVLNIEKGELWEMDNYRKSL